jgi:4-azaleucine resistance transporter AzlC
MMIEQTKTTNAMTDLRLGFVHFLPVGIVIFGYGAVFGALAVSSGLTVGEACLMSLTIFAGASQFIALPMIQEGASIGALVAMALLVNLRHMLYGLNMGRKFAGAATWKLLGVSSGIVDETYAFATIGPGKRINSIPYYMGTAVCAYVTWNGATLVGGVVANLVPALGTGGLDFAMVAVFISMIGSSIRKGADWVAVGLSILVAFAVHTFMGGYWHLFAAGLLVPLVMSTRSGGESGGRPEDDTAKDGPVKNSCEGSSDGGYTGGENAD